MAMPDVRTTLGDLIALPWQLTRSALLVPGLVNQAARILEDVAGIVAATEELLSLVSGTLSRIQQTADAAAALPLRVARMIEQSEQLPNLALHAIQRATGVFDGASTIMTKMDGMPERLRPLLDAFASLDPGVATQLGHLIPSVGPLMSRIEDEVIPSVATLQNLAPVVERLHLNVNELHTVVNEVGSLLAMLPGASLLRRQVDHDDASRVQPEPPAQVPPARAPRRPATPRAVKAAPVKAIPVKAIPAKAATSAKATPTKATRAKATSAKTTPVKADPDPDTRAGSGRRRRAPER